MRTLKVAEFNALVGWLLLCFGAAALAAFSVTADWYATLLKPSWGPPAWLFGPVWTILYAMMAVSAWLVWRQGGWGKQRKPLVIFVVQLAFNAIWTPLFFGLQWPDIAFIDIIFMICSISATIIVFRPVSRAAAILLVPYITWVCFAAVLNFVLWKMNS